MIEASAADFGPNTCTCMSSSLMPDAEKVSTKMQGGRKCSSPKAAAAALEGRALQFAIAFLVLLVHCAAPQFTGMRGISAFSLSGFIGLLGWL